MTLVAETPGGTTAAHELDILTPTITLPA